MEPNKIWTNSFGSLELEIRIFESLHQIWKKKNEKKQILKPNPTPGLACVSRSAHG
jgi:hypothetical protein